MFIVIVFIILAAPAAVIVVPVGSDRELFPCACYAPSLRPNCVKHAHTAVPRGSHKHWLVWVPRHVSDHVCGPFEARDNLACECVPD